ncbi:MAG: hypothetical protein ACRDSN_10120 [Pseudonocardiaceae bacterium]
MSVRKDRLISCRDVAGRRRDIIVFPDRGRVVMVSPPGETAVLTPLEVGRLRAALRDAICEAADIEGA